MHSMDSGDPLTSVRRLAALAEIYRVQHNISAATLTALNPVEIVCVGSVMPGRHPERMSHTLGPRFLLRFFVVSSKG